MSQTEAKLSDIQFSNPKVTEWDFKRNEKYVPAKSANLPFTYSFEIEATGEFSAIVRLRATLIDEDLHYIRKYRQFHKWDSENMYRIERAKHDPYIVNASHILSLKVTGDPNGQKRKAVDNKGQSFKADEICNIEVRDYLKCTESFRHLTKGYCVPVEFETQTVKVDPYFLGIWLGDGATRDLKITTPDKEIVDYIYELAKMLGADVKKTHSKNEGAANDYSITFHKQRSVLILMPSR